MQLCKWCEWWNQLHAQGLVKASCRASKPSNAITKAWGKANADSELAELLGRRDEIEAQLRMDGCWARQKGWLTPAGLLAGKNKQGEYYAQKLVDGAFNDGDQKQSKAQQRLSNTINAIEDFAAEGAS